ncbi:protein RKD1-like [Curcuma longa]|uniref:protein RKD1-like n=1 Tax=Curcuma longa TaxID=136217 RepID=UPI003D9DE0C0
MEFDLSNDILLLDQPFLPDWSTFCCDTLLPLPEASLTQYGIVDEHPWSLQLLDDDLDLDTFSWPDYYDLAVESIISDTVLPLNQGATKKEDAGVVVVQKGAQNCSERTSTSRLNEMGMEEMRKYFSMPITKAAKEMKVGLTLLKKRCRELGIARWPHRKMKSLDSLIINVQELGRSSMGEGTNIVGQELERLQQQRKLMVENPEMQLTERTKRLRQACFKANYKKRRLITF